MTSDAPSRRRSCHRRAHSTLALVVAACVLQGCAASSPPAPREYLDERTAATITVAPRAVVLACDRTDLGVHARDYVTLVSVDVNVSGRHSSYIVGYAWSTLDKRGVPEGPATYELVVDDRLMRLESMPGGFKSLGIATSPLDVPARGALPLAAPVSAEALRDFLEAGELRILRTRDGVTERFARWE